jgi:hypothetical protein
MNKYDFLLGKDLSSVKAFAEQNGLITRIVNVDSVPVMLTCDYNPSRLNLTIDNGLVTEIGIG